ncbi:hypothetical protein JCM5353_004962 [Sporobolomyces roseus]
MVGRVSVGGRWKIGDHHRAFALPARTAPTSDPIQPASSPVRSRNAGGYRRESASTSDSIQLASSSGSSETKEDVDKENGEGLPVSSRSSGRTRRSKPSLRKSVSVSSPGSLSRYSSPYSAHRSKKLSFQPAINSLYSSTNNSRAEKRSTKERDTNDSPRATADNPGPDSTQEMDHSLLGARFGDQLAKEQERDRKLVEQAEEGDGPGNSEEEYDDGMELDETAWNVVDKLERNGRLERSPSERSSRSSQGGRDVHAKLEPELGSDDNREEDQTNEDEEDEELDETPSAQRQRHLEEEEKRRNSRTGRLLNDYDDYLVALQVDAERATRNKQQQSQITQELSREEEEMEEEGEEEPGFDNQGNFDLQPEYGGGYSSQDADPDVQAYPNPRRRSTANDDLYRSEQAAELVKDTSPRSSTSSSRSRQPPFSKRRQRTHSPEREVSQALPPRRNPPPLLSPRRNHAENGRNRRARDPHTRFFTNRKLDGTFTRPEERRNCRKMPKNVELMLKDAGKWENPVVPDGDHEGEGSGEEGEGSGEEGEEEQAVEEKESRNMRQTRSRTLKK